MRSAPMGGQFGRNRLRRILCRDRHLPCNRMSPVSSPASMRMVVTPVTDSPRAIAHWIGAAPRYFGSSEACMFRLPRTRQFDHPLRNDAAVADDDDRVGIRARLSSSRNSAFSLIFFRLQDANTQACARLLSREKRSVPCRGHEGDPGCVTTRRTWNPASDQLLAACGTAKRGVPAKTRFMEDQRSDRMASGSMDRSARVSLPGSPLAGLHQFAESCASSDRASAR